MGISGFYFQQSTVHFFVEWSFHCDLIPGLFLIDWKHSNCVTGFLLICVAAWLWLSSTNFYKEYLKKSVLFKHLYLWLMYQRSCHFRLDMSWINSKILVKTRLETCQFYAKDVIKTLASLGKSSQVLRLKTRRVQYWFVNSRCSFHWKSIDQDLKLVPGSVDDSLMTS